MRECSRQRHGRGYVWWAAGGHERRAREVSRAGENNGRMGGKQTGAVGEKYGYGGGVGGRSNETG